MTALLLALPLIMLAQEAPDPRVADLVRAGTVRIALFAGQYTKDPITGEPKGVWADVARAFAARVGVQLVLVEHPTPPKMVECLKAGACDLGFLGYDPTRAADVEGFSPPFIEFDYTFLVPAGSSIRRAADADRLGVRIAVVRAHASTLFLTRVRKQADLVSVEILDSAFELLSTGQVEAWASARQVLTDYSTRLPGSRVLEDRYGVNRPAVVVAKGESARLAYISEFIEEIKASGFVQQAVTRSGWRGVRVAPPATAQRAAQTTRPNLLDTLLVPVQYVQVFGQRIAFYETGPRQAPTVILLPNLGWDSQSWAQNVPAFAREYHVIAIDPLGFGRSAKPLLDYKMDTWTDFLAEFMRVRGIARATFAGAIMGGALSVQMALDHPELVAAVVVAASNSGPGPHEGGMATIPSGPSLAGTRANLVALFHDSSLVTDAFVRERFRFRLRTNDGYTVQRHLDDHRVPYTRDELARIQVPALVVWCRDDRITPVSWGEQYAAALPQGRLVILEACGHLPNLEQPGAFNRAVLDFIIEGG